MYRLFAPISHPIAAAEHGFLGHRAPGPVSREENPPGVPFTSSFRRLRIRTAWDDSGTRCSCLFFMRSAGTLRTGCPPSRPSISLQTAKRTLPVRDQVSRVNIMASRVRSRLLLTSSLSQPAMHEQGQALHGVGPGPCASLAARGLRAPKRWTVGFSRAQPFAIANR